MSLRPAFSLFDDAEFHRRLLEREALSADSWAAEAAHLGLFLYAT